MSIDAALYAEPDTALDRATVTRVVGDALRGRHTGQRVLVIVPDHTRSVPLPLLLEALLEGLADADAIDILIALGTHPPLSRAAIIGLVGERVSAATRDPGVGRPSVTVDNHRWRDDRVLATIATITEAQIVEIAGGAWHESLAGDLPVRINRAVLDHDHVIIVGPTFPHEVVGFSGGSKYYFPGVSGPEMIDVSHWLGALGGVVATIGHRDTPPRRLVDLAASHVPTPTTLVAAVVHGAGDLDALVIGDLRDAWRVAVDQSVRRHIVTLDAPVHQVLSTAPPMYDELWTAAKAMYKLEPVLAEGAELILHAPHLDQVSRVHGREISEVGYHVLPYFLGQWDRFAHHSRAVLAHSSHLRGAGTYRDGVETPRFTVTLASRIGPDTCAALGLGHQDPATIDPTAFHGRLDEGVLWVPRAGETLYRLADPATQNQVAR